MWRRASPSTRPPRHRAALENAANRWLNGEEVDDWNLGDGVNHRELAPLLTQRAEMFLDIAADEDNWEA
jgi:hypothetical protein